MRLGLLSDIHGNRVALDAVLADAVGIDRWLVLGDLVAIGVEPVATLERLTALDDVTFIRGNTDRYTVTGDVPPPYPDEVHERPELLGLVTEIARNFTWTQGCLAATGWLDWLAGLPAEHRETLDDGTRLFAVHASPGTDDGIGITPDTIDTAVADVDADLVVVGHTHNAFDCTAANGVRVVNPGSVSNPRPADLRAGYAVIDTGAPGLTVEHRRVEYDREAVVAGIRRSRHPATDFLVGLQYGRHPT